MFADSPFLNTGKQLYGLIQKAGLRLRVFTVTALLAFLASYFEAFSLALLIPLLKGLISGDFQFVSQVPVLREIPDRFPEAFSYGNRNFVLLLCSLTFGSMALRIVLQYCSSFLVNRIVRNFENHMRRMVYERYLSFGKLFFDQHSSGKLFQVLMGYSNLVASSISNLQWILYAGFALTGYLLLMSFISWKLTLIVVLFSPALHFALSRLIQSIQRTSRRLADSLNNLSMDLSNALNAVPLIKAYTNEQFEQQRFQKGSDYVEHNQFGIDKRTLLINPLQELITLAFLILIVAVMCALVAYQGEGEFAEFAVYLVVLRRAATCFGLFNNMRSSFAAVSAPLQEILEVFNDDDKAFVPEGSREFHGLKDGIRFNHLSYTYPGGVSALRDISLFLERGKLTALVGFSGAGKSTVVNLLMRFYDSQPGSITVDGLDIRDFTLNSWRAKIALVGQECLLFNASLRENLTYGLRSEVSADRLTQVLQDSQLEDLLSRLPEGLETRIGDRGVKLSGGEKQRVSIARAMLKDTEILLLDEATSSLDSQTERKIQLALQNLIKGRTTIVVAHRLSTIQHADQLIVMEQGRVVEQGTFDELRQASGSFRDFWQAQSIL